MFPGHYFSIFDVVRQHSFINNLIVYWEFGRWILAHINFLWFSRIDITRWKPFDISKISERNIWRKMFACWDFFAFSLTHQLCRGATLKLFISIGMTPFDLHLQYFRTFGQHVKPIISKGHSSRIFWFFHFYFFVAFNSRDMTMLWVLNLCFRSSPTKLWKRIFEKTSQKKFFDTWSGLASPKL